MCIGAEKKSRKLLDVDARSDSFSFSNPGSSWWPWSPPSSAAQSAAQGTADEGEVKAGSQTSTTSAPYLLSCICDKPTHPTTAEALGQAMAQGKDSASAKAAAKAIADAGNKCCLNLGQALATAKASAEAKGLGAAFVQSAAKSESEANMSLCGKSAIASSIAESKASNGVGSANAKAQATATGSNAKTFTQTNTQVTPGSSSSSSFSFASSGKK